MVSTADKSIKTDLLWKKIIVLWLISSNEQGPERSIERLALPGLLGLMGFHQPKVNSPVSSLNI